MSEQLTTEKSEQKSQSLNSASQVLSEQDTTKAHRSTSKAGFKTSTKTKSASSGSKVASKSATPVASVTSKKAASVATTTPQGTQIKITLPKAQEKAQGSSCFTLNESHCKLVGDWKLNMNDSDTLKSLLPSQKTLSIAKYIKTFAYHTGKLVSPVSDGASWDVSRVSNKMQETMKHTYFSGHDKTLEDIFPKRYRQPSMADLAQRYVLDHSINVRRLYKGYIRPIASAFLDERTYNIFMPGQIVYLESNEDINPIIRPTHQIAGISLSLSSFNSNFTYEDGPDLPESAYLPYQPFKVERTPLQEQSYNPTVASQVSYQAQPPASSQSTLALQANQNLGPQPVRASHTLDHEPRTNVDSFVAQRPQSTPPHAYTQQSQAGYVPLSSQVSSQLAQTLELPSKPQVNPQINGPVNTPNGQVNASAQPSSCALQPSYGQGDRPYVYLNQPSSGQTPYQQATPQRIEPSFNHGDRVHGAYTNPTPVFKPYPSPSSNIVGVATRNVAGLRVVDVRSEPVSTTSFVQWASQQRMAAGYEQAVKEVNNMRPTEAEIISPEGGFVLDIATLSYLAQHSMPNKRIKLPWLVEMGVLVVDPFE